MAQICSLLKEGKRVGFKGTSDKGRVRSGTGSGRKEEASGTSLRKFKNSDVGGRHRKEEEGYK